MFETRIFEPPNLRLLAIPTVDCQSNQEPSMQGPNQATESNRVTMIRPDESNLISRNRALRVGPTLWGGHTFINHTRLYVSGQQNFKCDTQSELFDGRAFMEHGRRFLFCGRRLIAYFISISHYRPHVANLLLPSLISQSILTGVIGLVIDQ